MVILPGIDRKCACLVQRQALRTNAFKLRREAQYSASRHGPLSCARGGAPRYNKSFLFRLKLLGDLVGDFHVIEDFLRIVIVFEDIEELLDRLGDLDV